MDISATVIPKSDQLNSDDLISGPRTIRITAVKANEGNKEQPINVYFDGDNGKPYRPCLSMRRVMIAVWGSDASVYAGRSMKLYRDPSVTWGGLEVGGIRISAMSHIEAPVTLALTATKKTRKPYKVEPLQVAAPVDVEAGVAALISQINETPLDAREALLASEAVVKRRAWLAKNRPHLAEMVDAAIAAVGKGNE